MKILLKIGRATCSTDFAVRYYYNPRHKKFYKQKDKLKKAIRRIWAIGAFNHRKRIIDILEKTGYIIIGEKLNKPN